MSIAFKSILITGGAGFVGSNLAMLLRRDVPEVKVTALDSLKRRGSELNLPRLQAAGVRFIHGDVRCPEDFSTLPEYDLLIDCSAEPSVQAGVGGSPVYVLNTNLQGTINCLEAARQRQAAFLFLSTSRVYPIATLNGLPFVEDDTRFRWLEEPGVAGFSPQGVAEAFPLEGARSLYGASKLAGELLLQEYIAQYGMKGLINRCGILTGPWQMGKVDQGVVTLWVARHIYERPLSYIGYGGLGKQVRDMLHVEDLHDLLLAQMRDLGKWNGSIYNVGGGLEVSASLLELTTLCQEITGQKIAIQSVPQTSAVDLRLYLTDSRRAQQDFSWKPRRDVTTIVRDIHRWILEHRDALLTILN